MLVLAAATIHAFFNLLAKRAGASDSTAFVWLGTIVSIVSFAPFAIGTLILQKPVITAITLIFIAVSGVFHVSYCLTLQRAYKIGDLSLVYPIARGTGPLLAPYAWLHWAQVKEVWRSYRREAIGVGIMSPSRGTC